MTEQMLIQQWRYLPESLKQELLIYLEYLKFKYKIQGTGDDQAITLEATQGKPNGKKPLKAGFLKGTFVLAGDFDAPLEDFKDYMP